MNNRQAARPGLVLYGHPNDPPGTTYPPHKYSKELHDDIVKLIRGGFSPENAARASGLSIAMFTKWLSAGRDGDPWLSDFYADVDQAIAEANLKNERAILDGLTAEDVTKRAELALKIAERRDAKNWNKEIRLTVESQMTAFLDRCAVDPRLADVYSVILEIAAGSVGAAALGGAEEE